MKIKSLILCLIMLFSAGCAKKIYIPVETITHQTDTLRQLHERSDTLIIRDSVVLLQQGDTLKLTHYRDRLKIRAIRDTVYVSRTDTIRRRTSDVLPEAATRSGSDLRNLILLVILLVFGVAIVVLLYKLKK